MISGRRAPLVGVALAVMAGSAAGVSLAWPPWVWGALAGSTGAAWAVAWAKGWTRRSSGALLAFAGAAAAFHAVVAVQPAGAADVRLLSVAKYEPLAEWRGWVRAFPVYHAGDRPGTGEMVALVSLEAWRPSAGEAWQRADGEVRLRWREAPEDGVGSGNEIAWQGPLREPRPPRNPGAFPAARYWENRGVYYEAVPAPGTVRILDRSPEGAWEAWAARLREWTLGVLREGIEDDPAVSGLVGGMLMGDTSGIPAQLAADFRNTGTYHIFAVSGQNVGILAAVGVLGLQALGLVRWRWGYLVAPLLVFYVLATGAQPSAVRAFVMAVLVLLAWRMERPATVLNLWALAALVMLVADPRAILDIGFQLSFAVVFVIVVLSPPVYGFLYARWGLDPWVLRSWATPWQKATDALARAMSGLVAVSAAAWLGSLPLTWWHFHLLVPVGVPANLAVVPLASLAVVIGTLSAVAWPVCAPVSVMLNNANWLAIRVLLLAVEGFAQVPGGCVQLPAPGVQLRPPATEIVCLDTGFEAALLVRRDAQAWLVNCGSEDDFRWVVDPARRYFGIRRLDGVILAEVSLPMAGGAGLLDGEKLVGQWWVPDAPPARGSARWARPIETLEAAGRAQRIAAGDRLAWGGNLEVEVLWPPRDEASGIARIQDRGLVFRIEDSGRSVLWAGRIGAEVMAALAAACPQKLEADVLVQQPPPAPRGVWALWMNAVRPREVVLPARPPHLPPMSGRLADALPAEEKPRVWDLGATGAVTLRWAPDAWRASAYRQR